VVSSAAVVEGLDVVEDLGAQLSLLGPGAAVDEFLVERREEALGDRVIEAVALAAHRLGDACGAGLLAEGQADELAALIGVPDQTRRGLAARERHLQRVADQLGARMWLSIAQPTIRRE
jgi:hypothetical protein